MTAKPAHGQPCNNCGHCCAVEICPLGQHVLRLGPIGPCPALLPGHGCGLVVDPAAFAPARARGQGAARLSRAAAHLIGAGIGCDAPDEDGTLNLEFEASMLRVRLARATEFRRDARRWGIPVEAIRA